MQIKSASVHPGDAAAPTAPTSPERELGGTRPCGHPQARPFGGGGPASLPAGGDRSKSHAIMDLDRTGSRDTGRPLPSVQTAFQRLPVCIGRHALAGELTLVPEARGLVVFAHGSHCNNPQQRMVADIVREYRLDTLQFDLLTATERDDRERIFDVDLLTLRLTEALRWARSDERTGGLSTGLFGACTSAAAALRMAAQHPGWAAAVVLRSGRPDLAGPWLARVLAPTLLIVGGEDTEVLGLNRAAARGLHCDWRLEVVPGATNLFEESGALETVAHLAGNWFGDRLRLPMH